MSFAVFEARKQYDHLLSYKFNVPFDWFQPEASKQVTKFLFDVAQKSFPAFIQIELIEQFSGNGITKADLRLVTEQNGVINFSNDAIFLTYDLRNAVSVYSGLQQPISAKFDAPNPTAEPLMLPRSKSANFYLDLIVNNNKDIDDLTGGKFAIWITFFRNI